MSKLSHQRIAEVNKLDKQNISTDLISVLTSEYSSLKAEQTMRIGVRDNTISLNLMTLAAITTVAFAQSPINLLLLLVIPLVNAIYYWTYLNNDLLIEQLRYFLKEEFPNRVYMAFKNSEINCTNKDITNIIGGWESYHRAKKNKRKIRKFFNSVTLFLSFLGSSLAVLIVTFDVCFNSETLPMIAWLFDLLLTLLMLYTIIKTNDI